VLPQVSATSWPLVRGLIVLQQHPMKCPYKFIATETARFGLFYAINITRLGLESETQALAVTGGHTL